MCTLAKKASGILRSFCQGYLASPFSGVIEKSKWQHCHPLISEARETPFTLLQGCSLLTAISPSDSKWCIGYKGLEDFGKAIINHYIFWYFSKVRSHKKKSQSYCAYYNLNAIYLRMISNVSGIKVGQGREKDSSFSSKQLLHQHCRLTRAPIFLCKTAQGLIFTGIKHKQKCQQIKEKALCVISCKDSGNSEQLYLQ